MSKHLEFHLDGCIAISEGMDGDEFMDAFLELIESKNWTYGGSIVAQKKDINQP